MTDSKRDALEAALDEFIDRDPEAASRFIEREFGRIEPQKRLSASKALKAKPVAISDFVAMVIGWHALLNCDCENDQRDDAIEALVMALHRGNKRQYRKQAEPVAWPKKREPRAAEITESDEHYARSEGYDEGWNDCLAACMKQQAGTITTETLACEKPVKQAEPVDKALTNAEPQVDKEQADDETGNPSY